MKSLINFVIGLLHFVSTRSFALLEDVYRGQSGQDDASNQLVKRSFEVYLRAKQQELGERVAELMGLGNKPIFGAPVVDWVAPSRPTVQDMSGRFARLELLDAESHSAELFAANRESDQIWDYLPYGPFATEAAYRAWVEEVAEQTDPTFYAVRNLATGRAEGVASYLRIAPEAGSIEVGHINFSQPLQRTVAATEAIYLMMGWAFEAGYRRFEWKCDALNRPSCRAAQRFGFSYEGVFRQATVTKGRNRDTAWFACIDKEWPDLRAAYETWLDPANFDSDGRQIRSLADLTGPVLVARDPRAG